MYIHNLQTPEGLQLIKRLPAEVLPDGSVTYKFRTVGEYGCDMDTDLKNYPYDVHTCSLDVTVAESESEIDIQDGDILGTIAGCEGWDGGGGDSPVKVGNVERRSVPLRDRKELAVRRHVLRPRGLGLQSTGFTVFWIRAEGAGIDQRGCYYHYFGRSVHDVWRRYRRCSRGWTGTSSLC